MEFDEFLKLALPPLGYAWRPHRRRGVRKKILERMRKLHFCEFKDYLSLLQEDPAEQAAFQKTLPITVSRFFRNHLCFEFLRDSVLPDLLQKFPAQALKVWSVGIASGEEPYSIAMTWDYWLSQKAPVPFQILASDVDETMIERAKRGIYAGSSLREVPKELVSKYFEKSGNSYSLCSEIKKYVEWGLMDIRKEEPLKENHLISCCYLVFTYFTDEAQKELLVKIAKGLKAGGYLMIGKQERLPENYLEYFRPVSPSLPCYQRI